MTYPSAVLAFITGDVRVEIKNERVVLTHLQKFSRFGFMITWPFCFHFWVFWRPQTEYSGGWIPGTEQGIYFRTPGWRWDYDLGMKPTWGYLGSRWD